MILIISNSFDVHTDKVIEVLQQRQIRHFRLDTDSLPHSCSQSIRFSDNGFDVMSVSGKHHIDLGQVQTVWHRRQPPITLPQPISDEDSDFVRQEWKHFLSGLWHLLKDRFWINPLHAAEAAELKPYQLWVAQSIGLEIPRTLMTNDPDQALRFFDECDGQIIYKTLSQHARDGKDGKAEGIYTTRVQKGQLLSCKDQIRMAPCIFQEYVPKKVELRVVVIGHRIFAEEINTEKSERARDDWRRYDMQNTSWQICELPSSLEDTIHNAMHRMGLVFGCIDLVLTPDGHYVFLEINPMGQWLWVEALTGLPLLGHFVEMLIQGVPDYTVPEMSVPAFSFAGKDT